MDELVVEVKRETTIARTGTISQSISVVDSPDPWRNERVLSSNPTSGNDTDSFSAADSILEDGLTPGGPILLWDADVLTLEKQLVDNLSRSEESRERMELLKSKKLRRKQYIDTLVAQFRSLQGIKAVRVQEVEAAQKQAESKRREIEHIRLETTRTDKQIRQLVDQCDRDQTMLSRLKKEIIDMQTETELDRELMNACLDYAERHQNEFNLLKKYCEEDEAKLKECMYRITRNAVEDKEQHKEIESVEIQRNSFRLEISRLRENCCGNMEEQSSKVDHWAKIKSRITAADHDVERLHGELAKLAARRTAKEEIMQRQREFYESEYRNNQEAQKKMELTESNAIKARAFVADMQKKKQEFIDQVHALENECSNKQRAVRLTQSSITGLRHQTHLVKRDIERIQDQGADVGQKKLEVDRKTITDEERLTELSKTLDHREILVRTTEQNLVRLQDKNFKSTQQNVDLKAELEALVFSIRGNNMYLTSLHRQLKQKQNLAHNQAQQIYELQYKITQLNRRISFMEGAQSGLAEKSSDDVKILQAKRGNCQKEIMLMRTRLYKQEEFIKNLKKKLDRNEVEREKNEIALAEIMLYLHTTQQCLERVKVRKMESAAEISSSRLKLRYISDKAEAKLETVTSISIRQVELSGLFKERVSMIQMEREQYRAQTKRVDEQRSWLVKMLRELESNQRGVRTRYETLTMPTALDNEKDPTETRDIVQIQAAFFVKAARAKQNIDNQKTKLREDIQKVMEDNFRLRQFYENFEKQTNQMKGELYQVKQTTDLHKQQQELDNETAFVRECLRSHESHIYGFQKEMLALRNTKEKITQIAEEIQHTVKQDKNELKALTDEVLDQKKRLARTDSQNETMLIAIRKAKSPDDIGTIKADIEISVLMDVERLLFSTISRFLHGSPNAVALVSELFQLMAIQMSEELTKVLLKRESATQVHLKGPLPSVLKD